MTSIGDLLDRIKSREAPRKRWKARREELEDKAPKSLSRTKIDTATHRRD